MGVFEKTLKLPTDFDNDYLKQQLQKILQSKSFSYKITNQSLDARDKNNIHWVVRVIIGAHSPKEGEGLTQPLQIDPPKRSQKTVVVGSGPAGFFAALVLQHAGIQTTILERGAEVAKRAKAIRTFESTGEFNATANYAFGEGGAGTFSDGKLTSRTKHIAAEKQFMLSSYVKAGAPEEIEYLAHPHLGTDNLQNIVLNLRKEFIELGGKILFETKLEGLNSVDGKVKSAKTSQGDLDADYFIIATGNSAHDTYQMLMRQGVKFRTKGFALGFRMEHQQALINRAQWGKDSLPGVNAAEYRLTYSNDDLLPVYSFCMCPGGVVVPASAFAQTNIVNGMSHYQRNGKYANAGCVAGFTLDKLLGREVEPLEALDWIAEFEAGFYQFSQSYKAPYCSIQNFLDQKTPSSTTETSYPLGLVPAPLWELLPELITKSITTGLKDFSRKIKGFETGILLGLESKTSSPIQVLRDENRCCEGFSNLYMVGEGSGYAGGIISSGVDGIKTGIGIIKFN